MGSYVVVRVSSFHQTSWKFFYIFCIILLTNKQTKWKYNLLGEVNVHKQVGLSRHHVKQTMVGFDDYADNMTDMWTGAVWVYWMEKLVVTSWLV